METRKSAFDLIALPSYPPEAVDAGRDLIATIITGEALCSPERAMIALDEWFTSTDIERLTELQKFLLACALLETFENLTTHGRVSPSLADAIHYMWPALPLASCDATRMVSDIVANFQVPNSVPLDEIETLEIGALDMFICGLIAGNIDAVNLMHRLRLLRSAYLESNDIAGCNRLDRAMSAVENCRCNHRDETR